MFKLFNGDCCEVMKDLPNESVHAIITDPPYGLEFMGKEWDSYQKKGSIEETSNSSGGKEDAEGKGNAFSRTRVRLGIGSSFQSWVTEWGKECLRVLKPNGSLLAFGGTRTYHRLMCGLEDAGFKIKDTLMWCYLSGFPKAVGADMLIEKKLGGKGKIIGKATNSSSPLAGNHAGSWVDGQKDGKFDKLEPTLTEAKEWVGWKVGGLKPAYEPIVWCIKPSDKPLVETVLSDGIGAFNANELRIPFEDEEASPTVNRRKSVPPINYKEDFKFNDTRNKENYHQPRIGEDKGRFPANIFGFENVFTGKDAQYNKYFFTPKAGKEKHEDPFGSLVSDEETGSYQFRRDGSLDGKRTETKGNTHPTVKPVEVMEWLIKLVVKRNSGAMILDPFMGSGTTFLAARAMGVSCLGVEREKEYCEIAAKRFGKGTLGEELQLEKV